MDHITDSKLPRIATAVILRCSVALLASAVLLAPATGQAGPPYLTDDPEPVGLGHWEVYLATQHFIGRDMTTGSGPLVDLNYGALPGLHLHVMGQFAYARSAGGPTFYGVGDTEIGAKIRFVNEGDWLPMMSVYPMVDFPTGDATRGLGTGRTHAFAPLWLQKSFGPWTTFGGGGLWVNPGTGNRDYWYIGWELQRRISNLATVGTEIFYMTPAQIGANANLGFDVGLVIDLSELHHLMLSAGRSIMGDGLFQGYAAYQLTL
jgi:hypothetical protein